MRFAIATALLGGAGLTVAAAAQTPPAAPAIARTVVAGTKLPSLGDTSLYFRVQPRPQLDHCGDDLALRPIRNTHDIGLHDVRMLKQDLLDGPGHPTSGRLSATTH